MAHGDTEERFVDVTLKETEVLAYGRESAGLQEELKGFEADKKVISDQMKPRKKRVSELSKIVDTGIEHRSVQCIWDYDWDKGIKNLRRVDNDEIVGGTQQIEEHEEQPLPLD